MEEQSRMLTSIELIEELRIETGLSPYQFGLKVGVDAGNMYRICHGQAKNVSLTTMMRVVRGCGKSAAILDRLRDE